MPFSSKLGLKIHILTPETLLMVVKNRAEMNDYLQGIKTFKTELGRMFANAKQR